MKLELTNDQVDTLDEMLTFAVVNKIDDTNGSIDINKWIKLCALFALKTTASIPSEGVGLTIEDLDIEHIEIKDLADDDCYIPSKTD